MSRLTRDFVNWLPIQGYHFLWLLFPKVFRLQYTKHWPDPLSLVTTNGVSIDFLSSGYLDISVHQVSLARLCIQHAITAKTVGFPHSEICGSKLVNSSPQLIAVYNVLHRLLTPRHPSSALNYLFASTICTQS